MDVGKVFNGSNSNMANVSLHHDQVDSLWMTNSSPFHGSASMVDFEEKAKKRPFSSQSDKEEHENEGNDGYHRQAEKKRRLLPGQVQFLERSFAVENKLEPERKVQLAKEIGLQPRQVAIWFQNRRARYKTKLLEKEYNSLKDNYDKLKADYDSLFEENEKLKTEVEELNKKLQGEDKSEPCDPIPIAPLDSEAQNQCLNAFSKDVSSVAIVPSKQQEDGSCAKSDVIDSDSPLYYYHTDGNNHSSMLEPDDSSHIFEPDLSDFSQDEDDNSLSKRLLSAPSFPKLEVECFNDLQQSPCILGQPIEDHATWFWNC